MSLDSSCIGHASGLTGLLSKHSVNRVCSIVKSSLLLSEVFSTHLPWSRGGVTLFKSDLKLSQATKCMQLNQCYALKCVLHCLMFFDALLNVSTGIFRKKNANPFATLDMSGLKVYREVLLPGICPSAGCVCARRAGMQSRKVIFCGGWPLCRGRTQYVTNTQIDRQKVGGKGERAAKSHC